MNDLISRSTLLEIFDNDIACFETSGKTEKEIYISVADMRKMIEEQPTAYNVEKIVEEIETYINHYNNYESICVERGDKKEAHTFSCLSDGLCKALEIVRNGGSGYE